jgi:hypothetical protein
LHRKGDGIRVHADPVGFLRGQGEPVVSSTVRPNSRHRTVHRAAWQFSVVWAGPDLSAHHRRV